LSSEERYELIGFIARNPGAGVSIGGGVRKVRFARSGSGKSGGYRVVHFYGGHSAEPIFLLTIFAKNEKSALTKTKTDALKKLGGLLSDTYRRPE